MVHIFSTIGINQAMDCIIKENLSTLLLYCALRKCLQDALFFVCMNAGLTAEESLLSKWQNDWKQIGAEVHFLH